MSDTVRPNRLRSWSNSVVAIVGIAYVVYCTMCLATAYTGSELDGDQKELIKNLNAVPTIWGTMRWWTNHWVGAFHYWRPLTCHIYWIELHLFTAHHTLYWNMVTFVSELLVQFLLALVVKQLTGRWFVGLLAAVLFAGIPSLNVSPFFLPNASSTSIVEFTRWKDQPDFWTTAATLGTIAAALSGRWGVATICAAAAPAFKENGWVAIPFTLALLGIRGSLGTIPRRYLVVNAAIIAAWIALRIITGTDVFDIQPVGHNINWLARYCGIVNGPFFGLWNNLDLHLAVCSAAIAVSILAPRLSLVSRLIVALVGSTVAAAVAAREMGGDFAAGLETLIDIRSGLQFVTTATWWIVLMAVALIDKETRILAITLAVFRLICACTVAIGLAVGTHTVFMSNLFYCALYAVALDAMWRAVKRHFGDKSLGIASR